MIVPRLPRRFTLIVLCYAGIILSWLGLEDNAIVPVALIGAGGALVVSARWLCVRLGGRAFMFSTALAGGALFGMVSGAGAAVLTALLMLFKNGMHGHIFPDYPGGLIIAMLARAPLWSIAGALLGAAFVLFRAGADAPDPAS
jgi:uncharacterized membrane protein